MASVRGSFFRRPRTLSSTKPFSARERRSPDKQTSNTWSERFKNVALGVAGVISSIAIPLVGYYFTSQQSKESLNASQVEKNQESAQKYIELGIKILSEKPLSDDDPIRKWAIEIVNRYSDVKLSDAAQNALKSSSFFSTGSITKEELDRLQDLGYTMGAIISHFNGDVDFELFKRAGIKFVYIKATQGLNDTDPSLPKFAEQARSVGLAIGLYHFYAPDGGGKQADNFIKVLRQVSWSLPPTIDFEDYPNHPVSPSFNGDALAVLNSVKSAIGRAPLVYTYRSFANKNMDNNFSGFPLFVADFANSSRQTAPRLPSWWTADLIWHVASGVSNDPTLGNVDIILSKNAPEELARMR